MLLNATGKIAPWFNANIAKGGTLSINLPFVFNSVVDLKLHPLKHCCSPKDTFEPLGQCLLKGNSSLYEVAAQLPSIIVFPLLWCQAKNIFFMVYVTAFCKLEQDSI